MIEQVKTSESGKRLVQIEDLDRNTILSLLNQADINLKTTILPKKQLTQLAGKVVTLLFFEPSTRTRESFVLAAKRLGMIVLNPQIELSSVVKGESLVDTVQTFLAMGTDVFVLRHSDNYIPREVAAFIQNKAAVINGGDGTYQHPTQALVDLLTISQCKGSFTELKVAIIGDIAHSRVARSLILGLRLMETCQIRLIAPKEWIPEDLACLPQTFVYSSLSAGLQDADVVVALRIQRERLHSSEIPDPDRFFYQFGLTAERLDIAKKNVIVLHPGPINRGIEITADVADGPQSVILRQVFNGIAIRMAVMQWLLDFCSGSQ